jgi:16S rRNA (uracil1498-N3)-methyltransferase
LAAKNHDRRKYIDLVHNLRMRRVHVPGACPPSVVVVGGDVHHLTHVLRLSRGDQVVVFDGGGREWLGRIETASKSGVTIALVAERAVATEPSIHVTLGVGVLKAELDQVVRDATALGVSAIVPFVSARVAVSERAWKTRSTDRWQRIASAAAAQSGRAVVPTVEAATTFDTLLSMDAFDLIVACVEPAASEDRPTPTLPRAGRVLLLVGPEGGWAPEELQRLKKRADALVTLGPRTLRAALAPTVALAVLWTRWDWK